MRRELLVAVVALSSLACGKFGADKSDTGDSGASVDGDGGQKDAGVCPGCDPTFLVALDAPGTSLALESAMVYVAIPMAGAIVRFSKATKTPTLEPFATGIPKPTALARTPNTVFVATARAVVGFDVGSKAIVASSTTATDNQEIVANDDTVAWREGSTIHLAPLTLVNPTSTAATDPRNLAIDANHVYFFSDPSLKRIHLTDQAQSASPDALTAGTAIDTDDTFVWVASAKGLHRGAKATFTTVAPALVVPNLPPATSIAVSGSVYIALAEGRIVRVEKNTIGPVVDVVRTCPGAHGLVADPSDLYWICDQPPSVHTIKK